MIALLKAYLKIDTSHPEPNYIAVGALFKERAEVDGLIFRQTKLLSGYPVYCITLEGIEKNMPSLILNHHMDVVSADANLWSVDPFAAHSTCDRIIARGIQDCKALGVVQYAALYALKNKKPRRTIHMLLVPHEEVGGFVGVGQLIQTDFFKHLSAGMVLDEGLPSGNTNTLLIKIAERKPLQITVMCNGTSGHAALSNVKNPVHELIQALQAVRILMENYEDTSCHITSLCAGSVHAHNVIPAIAQATLDIRIAPAVSIEKVQRDLATCLQKFSQITLRIDACVPDVQYKEYETSSLYQTINKALQEEGLRAEPICFAASSDLRWYEQAGLDGYGLTPFTAEPALHAIDESLTIEDFEHGLRVYAHIVRSLCC